MTGALIGAAPARISAAVRISPSRPMLLKAPHQNRRRPNSSARNAGQINAQIDAQSGKTSNAKTSASIMARKAAMTAHAARARRVRTASPYRPCRALIAPLRCLPR